MKKYIDYIVEQAVNLLNIDSPSGYGKKVTQYLLDELERLDVKAQRTVKERISQQLCRTGGHLRAGAAG